jgi:hypothetical protein
MTDVELCPQCGEPVSDRLPCGCSFTPNDPRYRQAKPRELATPCAWGHGCTRAVKERWDPLLGLYRAACARHASLASPLELRALGAREARS